LGQSIRHAGHEIANVLHTIGAAGADADGLARLGVAELPRLVASELTTLSVCDLATGRRRVIGNPAHTLSCEDVDAFDRHFFDHPLVRFHSAHPEGGTHRISDSVSRREFRRSALYNDYYRRIGIDHAVAIPLYVDGTTLVSFVLNRAGRDFGDDEIEMLDRLRGWLAAMYRSAVALQRAADALRQWQEIAAAADRAGLGFDAQRRGLGAAGVAARFPGAAALTPREREILDWVTAGKSDRQIASIVGASPRTVHKHLEHIYVKLGVENRTAAAMRARSML
jgi:DNA-binding CsgD family transcriptional regulator